MDRVGVSTNGAMFREINGLGRTVWNLEMLARRVCEFNPKSVSVFSRLDFT